MDNFNFTPQNRTILESFYQQSTKAAAVLPSLKMAIILNTLIAFGVMAFEWEILNRVFQNVSGEDSEFFSPEIMALSSFILVCAIHFLVEKNAQHPALRFINRASGIFVPIYLFGIGLLLAALIYIMGLSDLITSLSEFDFEDLSNEPWFDQVMTNIASPLGAGLFSFGIGGLAVINVFVAHHAMDRIRNSLNQINQHTTQLKADSEDYRLYCEAETAFHALNHELERVIVHDDDCLIEAVTQEVWELIQTQIQCAKAAVVQSEIQEKPPVFAPQPTLNIKQLKVALKPLEAITSESLKKHLK